MQQALFLPEAFINKLKLLIPKEQLESVLTSFMAEKPVSFRVNTLKTTSNTVKDYLQQDGFLLEPVPWYTDAFILKNKSQSQLMETPLYKEGKVYIQNLSSMVPVIVLNPKSHETILDICAAPGSKTSQIATFMQNTGEIIANDTSRIRLYKLVDIMRQQGVTNTKTSLFPGQALWKKYPHYFDKVLVDVPCSMEGRFQNDDVTTFKDWSPKKVKLLANLQKYLLRSAISVTKPGGEIVYSTCTLSPEENEGVIDWVLKKEHGIIALETIHIDNLVTSPGLTKWSKSFDKQLDKTARILPSQIMEGFFVAKIKKL